MAKVLIANVGNRTLVAKNENGELVVFEKRELAVISKKSFKEDTKQILEKIKAGDSSHLNRLEINILNCVIDEIGVPDFVYLFTSDQTGGGRDESRKRQDTLYAGEILVQLLTQKYPNIQAFSIPLTGKSAVDLGELTAAFREELKKIVFEKHPEDEITICDSGGTPQQKNALKIVTEYFLAERKPTYYQVREEYDDEKGEPKLGQGTAERIDAQEIGKIVDAQNIGLLINAGEYAAAAKIRQRTDKNGIVEKFCWLLHFRQLLLKKEAMKQVLSDTDKKDPDIDKKVREWIKANPQTLNHYAPIDNFLNTVTANHNNWKEDVPKEDFFRLCEVLEVAAFYWHKDDITKAVHNYCIFMELFIELMLKKNGIKDARSDDTYKTDLQCESIKKRLTENGQTLKDDKVIAGIPANIAYLLEKKEFTDVSKQIILSFKKCHSWWAKKETPSFSGLDNLRNNFAHGGQGIMMEDLIKSVNDFEAIIKIWHQRVGVPFEKEQNSFICINEILKKQMKLV